MIYGTKNPFGNNCLYPDRAANSQEAIKLPDYFAFNADDGTYQEIPEFFYGNGQILVGKTEDEEYYRIYDMANNTTADYRDFPAESVEIFGFSDTDTVVHIQGADGNDYYTVIDRNGKQRFEPVQCRTYISMGGSGLIITSGSNNEHMVMDLQGNILVPVSAGYTFVCGSSNGLVYAYSKDGDCFLGLDGKPLTITLRE